METLLYTIMAITSLRASVTSINTTPCLDPLPVNLLRNVMPPSASLEHLPAGVELLYDERAGTHVVRLSRQAAGLALPAHAVFGQKCQRLPLEFSLLVTFKTSSPNTPTTSSSSTRTECLLAVAARGSSSPRLAVYLRHGRIRVLVHGAGSDQPLVANFRRPRLADGQWHSVVISLTSSGVSLRADCERLTRHRKVTGDRHLTDVIIVHDHNVHIGNCNNGAAGLFTGLLKDIVFQPGYDLSRFSCPTPALPPSFPGTTLAVTHATQCTWSETGKLGFDFYRRSLNVCFSGIWQSVLEQQQNHNSGVTDKGGGRGRVERLDYWLWHQDIVTAAPTIDVKVFSIEGEGLFIALASFNSSEASKQQSTIFKWHHDHFRLHQSIYTIAARGWETFRIGTDNDCVQFFIIVVNQGSKRDKPSKSIIYRWNRTQKRFVHHQELVTWTARDAEYFQIGSSHFLAIANHAIGNNHSVESPIFRWDEGERKFVQYQTVVTIGAQDWTHFEVEGNHFLVVANAFSTQSTATTRLNSSIYFWQNDRFFLFQNIETYGATDWEYFRIRNDHYLAVVNAVNFGPHATTSGIQQQQQFITNSTIYRFNGLRKAFEKYQDLVTYSAIDIEYFEIGNDSFLAMSNILRVDTDPHRYSDHYRQARTRSVIYRWRGAEKFVPEHYMDTAPSTDWESYSVDGDHYVIAANGQGHISHVYKAHLVPPS